MHLIKKIAGFTMINCGDRMSKKKILVAVSGYFDPIHSGHIRYFKEAKQLGDKLICILSRNDQCVMKKGYYFLDEKERKEILESIKYIDEVVMNVDPDTKSVKTLETIKPDIFAKGGDRLPSNMPIEELEICDKLGIKLMFNIGGPKIQSSSSLVLNTKNIMETRKRSLVKSIFYRMTTIILDIGILSFFVSNLLIAGITSILFELTHSIYYYCYERIWSRIKWGYKWSR